LLGAPLARQRTFLCPTSCGATARRRSLDLYENPDFLIFDSGSRRIKAKLGGSAMGMPESVVHAMTKIGALCPSDRCRTDNMPGMTHALPRILRL
jgi:hypothetical protein